MDQHSALSDAFMLREDNLNAFEKPPEPIALFNAIDCSHRMIITEFILLQQIEIMQIHLLNYYRLMTERTDVFID